MDLCNQKRRKKSAVSGYTELLVSKAKIEAGGVIYFPSNVSCVEECITRFENKLVLWYNDAFGNTKAVELDLDVRQ